MSLSYNTRQQGVIPRIISVDDHVIEPPDVWTSRLPAAYADRAPRIHIAPKGEMTLVEGAWVETPGDGDEMAAWWHFEGRRYQIKRMVACPGMPPEEVTMEGVTYDDIAPGCYDPVARLADMDLNHVEASLCFPNYPRFAGQMFSEIEDRTLGQLCIEAYNDFMVDEWAGGSGGRLIPLCVVPLWDPELAAAEIRRNAARGVRAVAFSELPSWLGLPSIHTRHWDPFFQACNETKTVLCMHIGSGTKTVTTSPDAPTVVAANLIACNSVASMIDWLFSGVFDRFPDIQLLYAESQIGWIPYFVERADDTWLTHQWAQGRSAPSGRRRSTTPSTSRPASSRTRWASTCSTRSARTTCCSKPTTRTRTAPFPTARRWPRSCLGTCPSGRSTRSPGATPSSCSAWTSSPEPRRDG